MPRPLALVVVALAALGVSAADGQGLFEGLDLPSFGAKGDFQALMAGLEAFAGPLAGLLQQPPAAGARAAPGGGGGGGGALGLAELQAAAAAGMAALEGLDGEELEAAIDARLAPHCTEAEYTRSKKVPPRVTGPSLDLTLTTGRCELQWAADGASKELVCTGPTLSYEKKPIVAAAKHLSADVVTGKACALAKELGEGFDRVLFSPPTGWLKFDSLEHFAHEAPAWAAATMTPQHA